MHDVPERDGGIEIGVKWRDLLVGQSLLDYAFQLGAARLRERLYRLRCSRRSIVRGGRMFSFDSFITMSAITRMKMSLALSCSE